MSKATPRLLVKSAIVIFYLGCAALLLYMPSIYTFFTAKQKAITIYAPREIFSLEEYKEFEAKTGIHVNVTYFTTNEEMFAKLKINKGVGYDLILPSDYMIELMIQANLLQPLDHAKISHFAQLDKRLMNKFYDPHNKFSVPAAWIPYGIGFNRHVFNFDNTVSWDVVFSKEALHASGDHKISMLNDAREAIFLAGIYKFGRVDNFTESDLDAITKALIDQKEIVECYVESGAKYLLVSDIIPLAVIPAARMKELNDYKNYGFVIPKEGSIIDIMSLVIPATSQKADLAHRLIDFLLSKEAGVTRFNEFACNPSNKEAYPLIRGEYSKNKAFFPDDEIFKRLYILNNKIPPKRLERIWFMVKSA